MKIAIKLIVWLILTIFLVTTIANVSLAENHPDTASFYVGVTYGGATVEGAKLLIDKVKDCTNLFILASGNLQQNTTAIEEIGDYAIAAGLNFAPYFGTSSSMTAYQNFAKTAQQRWGNHFTGMYFFDEPGGKILDATDAYLTIKNNTYLAKRNTGNIIISEYSIDGYGSSYVTNYCPNGTVKVTTTFPDKSRNGTLYINHQDNSYEIISNAPWREKPHIEYPNGTKSDFTPYTIEREVTYCSNKDITIWERDWASQEYMLYTKITGSARIAQVEPLSTVLNRHPLGNDVVAQAFETYTASYLQPLKNQSATIFTADYGLYWWDFRSGYDFVLAELGWNNTLEQEIALVRGAANLQGKSWGTILTWKYTHPPFLADGQEMFEQMKTSYEAGAKYVVIFNYSEDPKNPDTLQEEHFQALERFWTEVVQNPDVTHGSIKAEAALVLPKNFGWGMRNPQDTIWGLWPANDIVF
jgi:hypothetical protein